MYDFWNFLEYVQYRRSHVYDSLKNGPSPGKEKVSLPLFINTRSALWVGPFPVGIPKGSYLVLVCIWVCACYKEHISTKSYKYQSLHCHRHTCIHASRRSNSTYNASRRLAVSDNLEANNDCDRKSRIATHATLTNNYRYTSSLAGDFTQHASSCNLLSSKIRVRVELTCHFLRRLSMPDRQWRPNWNHKGSP